VRNVNNIVILSEEKVKNLIKLIQASDGGITLQQSNKRFQFPQ